MEEEPSTTDVLRAPSHVEAIISNGVLRQPPPLKKKSLKFLSQSSPAISTGMLQCTIPMSTEPHLDHYFFLCSNAQLKVFLKI